MSIRKKHLSKFKFKFKSNKRQTSNVIIGPPDNQLIIIIIALAVIGIMAVFSAGAPEAAESGNPYYFVLKHIASIVIGSIFLIIAANSNYKRLKGLAAPFAIFTIVLIAATYVPGLGRTEYGAARWLVGIPIQPSEFAKISVILLMASALSEAKTLFNPKLLKHLLLTGIMILLILKQPNLSISMVVTFIAIALMLVGGVASRLLVITIGCLIPLVYINIMNNLYQLKRITGWLDPWADAQSTGYNLIQSWYAIAGGGIFGVGFGNSKQKLFWLPFRHTDFIFSVIAEEFGLIGSLILIGLFFSLFKRGLTIAARCGDQFGKLLAFGIAFSIVLQAFINISVATGVFPVTGVTLPLISYGGSSVVVTLTLLGILLNISRKRIKRLQPNEQNN